MKRQNSFKENNAKIYLVATPIGNLKDITYRAIETLNFVDIIYCEDTRTSLKLLNHYSIKKPLKSVHLFNEKEIAEEIVNTALQGQNVAVISDAGLPIISDPGSLVVKLAVEKDVDVVPIPGANAALTALIASGIDATKFLFVGFLNHKVTKKKEELKKLVNNEATIILYEAPHKLLDTLNILNELYSDRQIVLARELTKLHEEFLRGTPKEILEIAENLKGEMVIIIEGCKNPIEDNIKDLNNLSIEEHYNYYISQNIDSKTAMGLVAKDRGISKKEVYNTIKK